MTEATKADLDFLLQARTQFAAEGASLREQGFSYDCILWIAKKGLPDHFIRITVGQFSELQREVAVFSPSFLLVSAT